MKKSRLLIISTLFILSQNSFSTNPDEWSGPRKRVIWNNWSVNINLGFTSYFGDLSQYDLSVINKLLFESKPAYGIKLTKYIKNKFGISGQILYGGFKSDYRPEHSFKTKLFEYSIQAGLDIVKLIFPCSNKKYGLEAWVGAGQLMFQTSRFVYLDGLQSPVAKNKGVPEFVYFFGGGFYSNISNRIRITADLSIRQAQNDNLDNYFAHGDFDYYSYLSIGVTYSISKILAPTKYKSNIKLNKETPVWRIDLK